MSTSRDAVTLQGHAGSLHVRSWTHEQPSHLVVIAHGYAEHIGRYDHVAATLGEHGAAVYGPDHLGHGRSDGERALITDFDPVVDDLHLLVERARTEHPGLPLVLVGHSMGGLIATRYAQRHRDGLAGLVLSAPLLGNPGSALLLAMDPLPEVPIDPAVLSRDESVWEAYRSDPLNATVGSSVRLSPPSRWPSSRRRSTAAASPGPCCGSTATQISSCPWPAAGA
jgi:alpha-beta hydrolase superfamily lysophospholipase